MMTRRRGPKISAQTMACSLGRNEGQTYIGSHCDVLPPEIRARVQQSPYNLVFAERVSEERDVPPAPRPP